MTKTPENFQPSPDEKRRLWRGDQRVNERVNDPLKIGREVVIETSPGESEGGWKIKEFQDNGNIVIVEKNEGGELLEETTSISILERLNPPQE